MIPFPCTLQIDLKHWSAARRRRPAKDLRYARPPPRKGLDLSPCTCNFLSWDELIFSLGNRKSVMQRPRLCEACRKAKLILTWREGHLLPLGKRQGQRCVGGIAYIFNSFSLFADQCTFFRLNSSKSLRLSKFVLPPVLPVTIRWKFVMNSILLSSSDHYDCDGWLHGKEKSGRKVYWQEHHWLADKGDGGEGKHFGCRQHLVRELVLFRQSCFTYWAELN